MELSNAALGSADRCSNICLYIRVQVIGMYYRGMRIYIHRFLHHNREKKNWNTLCIHHKQHQTWTSGTQTQIYLEHFMFTPGIMFQIFINPHTFQIDFLEGLQYYLTTTKCLLEEKNSSNTLFGNTPPEIGSVFGAQSQQQGSDSGFNQDER